jgi:hypothetical protein
MACIGYLNYLAPYCSDGVNSNSTNGWTQGSIVGVLTRSIVTAVVSEVQFMSLRDMVHHRNDIVDRTVICNCCVKLSSL